MIRVLQPWHANLGKRQVKSPKIYFRDSGLFHYLLGVKREADLVHHPRIGASWEGYAIEEAIKAIEPDESYYWGTHNGAELDLLVRKDGAWIGIECKRVDAPRATRSMQIALEDLGLEKLIVFYPGGEGELFTLLFDMWPDQMPCSIPRLTELLVSPRQRLPARPIIMVGWHEEPRPIQFLQPNTQ
jgi:predicted AAA+ superfamily ATPase